ncbi:Ig-like domain-containing protein [Clostridium sp. 19966]|uniref:Ig-like domain-containing protein n=1 Tax=Clostridium sp. 19966 TaxID=2768166 RepID=UPI0028E048CA|nr:Ig-like domain-containing protein [Clostridium sp. 19966]MDT8717367.1 Ig-like domain-containing protein [Clostridium sp. 19966]
MKKLLYKIMAVIFLFSIVSNYGALNIKAAALGRFKVEGSKIIGPDGNEFIPKGVNVQGLHSWEVRNILQDVDLIANAWKFNVVRLNCFIGANNPWGTGSGANDDIDAIIKAFTDRHVVVLVEMHDSTGLQPYSNTSSPTLDEAKSWFSNLAAKYKDNTYVWYGTMNEPGSSTQPLNDSWDTVNKTLIQSIRSAGADNIVVCDGWNYASEGLGDSDVTIPDNKSAFLTYGQDVLNSDPNKNTIFALHNYLAMNVKNKLEDFINRVEAKGLYMFLEEYGNDITDSSKTGVKASLQTCYKYNLGRVYWNWDGFDLYDLTSGTGRGSGWEIDKTDGSKPTNLSWVGDKIWDDNHGNSVTFDDTNPKTDLGLERLISNDTTFKVGDKIKFTTFLHNTGDIPVNKGKSTFVKFYVDGKQIGDAVEVKDEIGTDTRVPITSPEYIVENPNFVVKAEIDNNSTYVDGANDALKDNNSITKSFSCDTSKNGYDLAVTNIKVTPDTVNEGDYVEAEVTVSNLGNQTMPSQMITGWFYINDYYYTGADSGPSCVQSDSPKALAPGESITLKTSVKYRASSSFNMSYVLENKYKDDLNPSNNAITVDVPVKASEDSVNIITNPGFEDGINNWQDWQNDMSVTADSPYAGKASLKIWGGKAAGGGQNFTLKPNTTYILGMWGKFDAKPQGTCDAVVQYHLKDSNNTYIQNMIHFNETEWTYKQVTFTTPAEFGDTPQLAIWKGDTTSANFYGDNVTLVEVNNNILQNTSFENGKDGWQDWQNDMSVVPEAAYTGSAGLKIGGGKAAGGGQNFNLKPNTTYILGMWGKFDAKPQGTCDAVVQYHLKDTNSTYIKNIINFNETEWTYKQIMFTTPAEFGDTPQLAIWKGDTTNADFYADNVILTEVKNEVVNGTAENKMDSWQDWQSAMAATPEAAKVGNYGFKISGAQAAGGGQDISTLKTDTTYMFGLWSKFDNKPTTTFDAVLQYHLKDANNTYVKNIINFNETDWTYKQTMFTTPSEFGTTPQLALWKGDTSGADVYTDNIVVTQLPSLIYNELSAPVQVNPDPQPATISNIDDINANVETGEAYALPSKVAATYSDGSKADTAVTWSPEIADTSKAGTYIFQGTVAGYDKKITLTLTVTAKPVVITSIDDINANVEAGEAYILPSKVAATYSDGSKADTEVTWSPEIADTSKAGAYIFHGTVAGYDKKITLTLTVNPKPAVTITSIDNITVNVKKGESYTLPAAVAAKYSDGSIKDVAITWDTQTVDTSKAGYYEFYGTVAGYQSKVKLTLTVDLPQTGYFIDSKILTTLGLSIIAIGIGLIIPRKRKRLI